MDETIDAPPETIDAPPETIDAPPETIDAPLVSIDASLVYPAVTATRRSLTDRNETDRTPVCAEITDVVISLPYP